jgi:hypothetical protein
MKVETREMLTVVVLIEETDVETYAGDTKIHSVMTRPREESLERAWCFIKKQPLPSPGMIARYKVEVHSLDGALILKYQ